MFKTFRKISIFGLVGCLLITQLAFGNTMLVRSHHRYYNSSIAPYVPNEILVKFKTTDTKQIQKALHRYDASLISTSLCSGVSRVKIDKKDKTVEEMVYLLSELEEVIYAEPNFTRHAKATPNDRYYQYQWHLHDGKNGGINVSNAWEVSTGKDVIVAVLDTGVAYENYGQYRRAPDLAGTHFVDGYDFVNDDKHPNDDEGHGTFVTGVIGQTTNNFIGTCGIAYEAYIMPIKVLDRKGNGNVYDTADAIYYAVNHGAQIINMSFGSPHSSKTEEKALEYAHSKGVLVVAAAGNEYQKDNPHCYPAAYDAYCIAVGATDYAGKRAPYSNTGAYVDIVAPGGHVGTDRNHDDHIDRDEIVDLNNDGLPDGILQQSFGSNPKDFGYYFADGTSMAAPQVSAVAALLIAKGITEPADIRLILKTSTSDLGKPGRDQEYGWGLLNADIALQTSPSSHPIVIETVDVPSEIFRGELLKLNVKIANQTDGPIEVKAALWSDELQKNLASLDSIGLLPESSKDIVLNWNTHKINPGYHKLEIQVHGIGDVNHLKANTQLEILINSGHSLKVKDIKLQIKKSKQGWKGLAKVWIIDEQKEPVEDVSVSAIWKGVINQKMTSVTDKDGLATFISREITHGGYIVFKIEDLVKSGWYYQQNRKANTTVRLRSKRGNFSIVTKVSQNYPNPFNPETWIPFQLEENAKVTIHIYNSAGVLVRTFPVGWKEAGDYTSKQKAIYWDGRNNVGEKVTSGVYFYTFKAGSYSATRKMIVVR